MVIGRPGTPLSDGVCARGMSPLLSLSRSIRGAACTSRVMPPRVELPCGTCSDSSRPRHPAPPPIPSHQHRQVFEDRAKAAGFSLTHIPAAAGEAARAALRDVVGDGEYFQAFLPDGSYLVHPIAFGERHPLNYGREVLAELAGVPDRAEWKACAVSVEEERRRSEAFKALFKPHDIMGVQE